MSAQAAASETFFGSENNALVASVFGESGHPVLLLHGGGQTRHAWERTCRQLAQAGAVAYALDQRGHGESHWSESGAYTFADFAQDATIVARLLHDRHGAMPIAIGASLGGIASLLAQGDAVARGEDLFSALVMVDIAPKVDPNGVASVQSFMRAHSSEGFATIEDAAQAVADYLPHRPRPKSLDGLKKNLRRDENGRWRWHWDPRFLDGPRPVGAHRAEIEEMLADAARRVSIPAMLVRGSVSELVRPSDVQEFLRLIPHADFADVSGAHHMVAGDRNDDFSAAILEFLARRVPLTAAS